MKATKTSILLVTLALALFGCDAMTSRDPSRPSASTSIVSDSADVPAGYTLVWNDEFEGSGLPDGNKWSFETWGNSIGWGNGEIQQYLVKDLDNAYLSDGRLHIVARKEPISGKIWDGSSYLDEVYNYSSARLTTYPNPKTYGFIEVRAKIPGIAGTWPAIWLVGLTTWPRCGEIDIMEQWGAAGEIGGNFHVQLNHGNPDLIKHFAPSNLFTSFHNYQVLWTDTKITIMVDGHLVNTYEKDTALTGAASIDQWPFDSPESLILNLAIQGKGVWVDDAKFPIIFEVDYVRWYQKR